ncbi:MAG TPA: hypothetical protein VGQ76_17900 [Thermoanaerobaculia bacterium]|jgi:hypothetical protein|nr:hypothetical protein [Thermoanaerobaculia bacterium]
MMKPLLFSLSLLLCALPVSAQIGWSMVASAGEIDESSLVLYDYNGARLQFQNGADGSIVARYPVTNTPGSAAGTQTPPWDIFRITYIDTSAASSVSARLMSVDECSGAEEELCEVTSGTTGGTPGCAFCIFPPDIDFGGNAYYIEATVERSSLAVDPVLVMMSLSH